jgi:chromosome segregation ATPase
MLAACGPLRAARGPARGHCFIATGDLADRYRLETLHKEIKPMAAAKKRAPKSRKTSDASARQLAQLRATVKQLRTRLERETRARRLENRVLAEAKKARASVTAQVDALRKQGRKLAAQLKSTLTNAKSREAARKEALKMVAALKADLARRSGELRRKSEELRKLAQESAERAREIIRSESPPPQAPPAPEWRADEPEPPSAAEAKGEEPSE